MTRTFRRQAPAMSLGLIVALTGGVLFFAVLGFVLVLAACEVIG